MNKTLLIFLVYIFTSAAFKSFAGIEPYENFLKGAVKNNDSLIVKDEKFRNPLYAWSDISNITVKNTISLRILDEVPVNQNFTCEADLKVQYYSSPDQQTPTEIQSVKLKVNYVAGAGATYKITDSYNFSNGYFVKVYVNSISSPELGSNLPDIFQLTSRIVIDRQYKFKPEHAIDFNASFISSGSANNTMAVSWSHIPGAEEYDLEWATIDQGSDHENILQEMLSGGNVHPDSLNRLFRNNASRVTTPGNNYLLSLIFNAGYIAVRIRQGQYNSSGIRLEGNWDYDFENNNYAVWALAWHEQSKNWQYSATYAEDGKKKEVISYFDGTLRGRQTATLNNSDKVAVVQENIFDEFGRQAASVLPAPVRKNDVTEPYLHYFREFNKNTSGTSYNFQNLKWSLANCEFLPGVMNTSSGASGYYSGNNQFINEKKYNKYIPDAEGYPFSVTQYTADNTGRVKVQGGVGSMFQPGTSLNSKTTKYYYGKPEQWELDRIFGNDAGYAERYLKNMVIDPNGQVSISYLNASGKTIATALTGESPQTQDALSSAGSKEIRNIKLLRPEQFIFNSTALTLTASTTHLASLPGEGSFSYNIEKLISRYPGGAFQPCSNCHYELSIKIKNDCNETVYETIQPVKIGSETPNENDAGTYSDTFNVNFAAPGEYYISFSLALNKNVIENFTEEFITQGQASGAVSKEFDFIETYLKASDFSGGFSDCRTCITALGTKELFTEMFLQKLAIEEVDSTSINNQGFVTWIGSVYDSLKTNCIALQAYCYEYPCAEFEKLMLEDVAPGGQYALFDIHGGILEPEINAIAMNWRTEFPVSAAGSPLYDSDLITLENGDITSPYAAGFTLDLLVQYWKQEWASKFLKYHPEYCKLQFCQTNSNLFSWDEQIKEQINTATEIALIPGAQNLQYDAGNAAWLLAADPFFKAGAPGAAYYSNMQNDLVQYTSSVLGYTSASSKSLTGFIDYLLYCSDTKGTTNTVGNSNPWNNCMPEINCRVPDKEWQQYRDTYFEIKEKYYRYVRDNTTCAGSVCVIGSPYVFNLTRAITIKDFAVSEYTGGEPLCSPAERMVSVSYLPGPVFQPVTVEIYYPGQASDLSVPFNLGETRKIVCIPGNVPVNTVKVSEVIPSGSN